MNAKNPLAVFIVIAMMAVANLADAAELSVRSRDEIQHLLARLGNSGCEFNRNGNWYSAAEAQTHLTHKLDYLVKRNLLASSEDFIALGASTSSMSGKAYQVKCANAKAVDSTVWLGEALLRYRAQRRAR